MPGLDVGQKMIDENDSIVSRTILWIYVLFIGGLIMAVGGFAAKIDWIARTGTGLFLSGFGLWGLTNAAVIAWEMKHQIRREGIRVVTRRPWELLLLLFFLGVGGWTVWFVMRLLIRNVTFI